MSEPISTEISIGGQIPAKLVPGLCKAIVEEQVALDWCEGHFKPEWADDLLAACQEQDGVRVLWLCDNEANYGRLDVLTGFLEREKIAYRLKSDARFDIDAEVIQYRPGIGRVSYDSNSGGQPLIPLVTMMAVATAIDQAANTAERQTALELLRRFRNIQQLMHEAMPVVVPPLEPFEIMD
jgi:hypothetical protein